jgi:poly-beta-1,6-N-acetyl-D-glucosamine synthase
MQYSIVSPIKNEEKFIKKTIDSVINQTVRPKEYILVDDGSTDDTLSILESYAQKYDWIKVVPHNTKSQERAGGSKVVKAFYFGYNTITNHDYDFIVKLDGDLELPINYFEKIIEEFKADSKVGICGGYVMNLIDGELVQECEIDYHVRGAFKSIRKDCFDQIGGFKPLWNWDGLDEMEAMFRGWKTKVIELPVTHFRPTSGAYDPVQFNIKDGIDAYKLRSHFVLTIIRTLVRLKRKPYFIAGISYFYGYICAFVKREKRDIDKPLAKFINKFHFSRIF